MVVVRVRKKDRKQKYLQVGDLGVLVRVPEMARSIYDLVDKMMMKSLHVSNLTMSGGSCSNVPASCDCLRKDFEGM